MPGGLKVGIAPLEVLGETISGNFVAATTISGTNAVFGGQQINTNELAIGAVSGNTLASGGIGLAHHSNASISGLHLVAQGIGADRILNAALTATQMAVGAVSGAILASGGIGLPHLANASVSGLHLVAQGIGADRILNAALTATQLANNAASGLKVSPEYAVVAAGSPVAFGLSLLAGSAQTDGGSAAWVVFAKAFAAAPDFVDCANWAAAGVTFFVPGGSMTAGSFYVQSSAASAGFRYLVAGSGRL